MTCDPARAAMWANSKEMSPPPTNRIRDGRCSRYKEAGGVDQVLGAGEPRGAMQGVHAMARQTGLHVGEHGAGEAVHVGTQGSPVDP